MADLNASDVRSIVTNHCNSAEAEDSELVDGVRVAVHSNDVGNFFAALREMGVESDDWQSKRLGDTLVAHIPAEREDGLARLLG